MPRDAKNVRTRLHTYWVELDLTDAIQRAVYCGEYEPTLTAWISEALRPGHRFVDIGANCGYYTALASRLVGKSGTVFSFEPSPVVSSIITDMIATNEISNIHFERVAVGAENAEIEIYLPNGGPVHSPSAFYSDPTFKPLRVPMIALDRYAPLNDGKPIDLVKMDVEGFEPNVIAGMANLIKGGHVRNLICECNSGWLRRNSNFTPAMLVERICSLGMAPHQKTDKSVSVEADGKTPFEVQNIWFTSAR